MLAARAGAPSAPLGFEIAAGLASLAADNTGNKKHEFKAACLIADRFYWTARELLPTQAEAEAHVFAEPLDIICSPGIVVQTEVETLREVGLLV